MKIGKYFLWNFKSKIKFPWFQTSSTSKKKTANNSEIDSSGPDSDGNEPKKFSIFDEPIFDLDNPIYFSMYDKVKARRSCAAVKDSKAAFARQQEALLAKFNKLKKKRAEKSKKHRDGQDYDENDDHTDDHTDSEDEKAMTSSKSGKKKHALMTSSSDDDEDDVSPSSHKHHSSSRYLF